MLNPFRSEAEAYRFVWLTIGYFALIVIGALINRWLGLGVFVVLSALVAYFYLRRGERPEPALTATRSRSAPDERRILVVANETVGGEKLRECIRSRSEGFRERVLVVCPALNSPLRHWASDEDPARAAAQDRLQKSLARLRELGIDVHIWPVPVEIADPIRFTEDTVHAAYDAEYAHRFWQVLEQSARVLTEFRGGFLGKCSPVHFWWGAFDLACTRFSGRGAPPHPGGIPNCPDYVTREGYSHECISAGWWPGGGAVAGPAFYAYAYPEPPGLEQARIGPSGAYYHPELREFILPYEAVRTSADPDATLLAFLESTYDAAAHLARWDRAALERPLGYDPRSPTSASGGSATRDA